MNKIWITSDWHFCHNKEFLYKPRGFSNIEDMNKKLVENHNALVSNEDDVYVLGDLMLGDQDSGINYIKQLNGKLHIIRGNHCTDNKWKKYQELPNVVELCGWATMLKYGKYHFFLSHFPMLTANYDEGPKQVLLNLHGHTHQTTNFMPGLWSNYHVGMDSHNCYPVLLDNIIEEIKMEYQREKGE